MIIFKLMIYEEQKEYFERAYKTGSDIWTHFPYERRGAMLAEKLSANSLILDLGSGRGLWAFDMVNLGYRAIGVDYVKEMVSKSNADAEIRGLDKKVRFIESNVLDLPLQDNTFDAATDFGLLQHIHPDNWAEYTREVSRVIKSGGYFLKVVFSKETTNFLGFNPKGAATGQFEKDGIHYYFFTKEEIAKLFEKEFEVIEQKIEILQKKDAPIFISTLFKKK